MSRLITVSLYIESDTKVMAEDLGPLDVENVVAVRIDGIHLLGPITVVERILDDAVLALAKVRAAVSAAEDQRAVNLAGIAGARAALSGEVA